MDIMEIIRLETCNGIPVLYSMPVHERAFQVAILLGEVYDPRKVTVDRLERIYQDGKSKFNALKAQEETKKSDDLEKVMESLDKEVVKIGKEVVELDSGEQLDEMYAFGPQGLVIQVLSGSGVRYDDPSASCPARVVKKPVAEIFHFEIRQISEKVHSENRRPTALDAFKGLVGQRKDIRCGATTVLGCTQYRLCGKYAIAKIVEKGQKKTE